MAESKRGRGEMGVMRLIAIAVGVLAVGALAVWPTGSRAQAAPAPPSAAQLLSQALFVNGAGAEIPADPAFRTASAPAFAPIGGGVGLIGNPTSEVVRPVGGGAVDSMRQSIGAFLSPAMVGPALVYDPDAVDVSFERRWPGAVTMTAAGVAMNITPHAGFGVGPYGGRSAEAGARIEFGGAQTALRDKLTAMGFKDGGDLYGDRGRFYLFAAVRGQAVGLNMQAGRTGWSTDMSSALVGDGQVGVGWRKGGIEASFGYVHRGVHVENAPIGVSDGYADDMAALSFSWHPHW